MDEQKINHIDISLSKNDENNILQQNNKESSIMLNNIETALTMESVQYKKEPWCRLDKTTKIKKISTYVDTILKQKHSLTDIEVENVQSYLISCLDKVKLQKVKEVDYKKDQGLITNIPALAFEKTTRKFTLKRCDKRINTVRSLTKPRKSSDKRKKNVKKTKT